MLIGAEPVMPSTVQRFMTAFQQHAGIRQTALMPSYGLAEHVVFVCNVSGVSCCEKTGLVSHGHPQPDVNLKIVDPETASPVAPGEIGEIWVCSTSKAIGYYGQGKEEVNEEVFHGRLHPDFCDGLRYLRTGDLGYITDRGLFICGRIKDMIIIGGRNIFPQDIEESIADKFPSTRRGRIAVYRIKSDIRDDESSEGVGIAAELRPPFPDGKACHAMCDHVMSQVQQTFEIPVATVSLVPPRSLPTTTSGKIQRSRCKQMQQEGSAPQNITMWWAVLRMMQLLWIIVLKSSLLAAGPIPAYHLLVLLFYDNEFWFWYEPYSYTLPRPPALLLLSGVFGVFCLGQFVWLLVFASLATLLFHRKTEVAIISAMGFFFMDYVGCMFNGQMLWYSLLHGSPAAVAVLRAFQANVAWDTYIGTNNLYDHHRLHIGSGCVIDGGSFVIGHRVQAGKVILDDVIIGRDVEVQQCAVLCAGDSLPDGAVLGPKAKQFPGVQVEAGSSLYGVPASKTKIIFKTV